MNIKPSVFDFRQHLLLDIHKVKTMITISKRLCSRADNQYCMAHNNRNLISLENAFYAIMLLMSIMLMEQEYLTQLM